MDLHVLHIQKWCLVAGRRSGGGQAGGHKEDTDIFFKLVSLKVVWQFSLPSLPSCLEKQMTFYAKRSLQNLVPEICWVTPAGSTLIFQIPGDAQRAVSSKQTHPYLRD